MKSKSLRRTETLASVLLLTLALACKPAKDAVAQPASPAAAPSTAIEQAKAVVAAGTVRYEAQPTGSKMIIEGTANIKNWSMESVLVGGFIEADANFPESALTDAKAAKPVVNIFMPVRSFKSHMVAMDNRMQKEMNEPQFKRIEYKLIELKPTSAAGSKGALKFDAIGMLTVVGKTRTNTMPVTIEKMADGKLKVAGSTQVKMTDFGITPPSTLGLFVSGDDLTLKFEWLSAPKVEKPKTP